MNKADQALVDRIIHSLETNNVAVERAIILLGDRQTADEQLCHSAHVHNGVGFSKAHAGFGMWAYKILKEGGKLKGQALDKARRFTLRYARTQLLDAAKAKQSNKAT